MKVGLFQKKPQAQSGHKHDKVLPRDLSPLKPLLVEGVWNRIRSRLAPLEVEGASLQRDF